jgi:exonuclease V
MMQLMCYKEILDGMLAASNERHIPGTCSQVAGLPIDGDAASGSQACPISIDEDSRVDSEQAGSETLQQPADSDSAPQIDLSISEKQPFEDFSWSLLFRHLHLDPTAKLSEDFLVESRSVIHGNGLEPRLFDGKCLWDYVDCWVDLVKRLGLGQAGVGTEGNFGRSEDRLELVYRNVRTTSTKVDRKRKSRRVEGEEQQTSSSVLTDEPMQMVGSTADQLQATEEERLLALAIEESLKDMPAETSVDAGFAEIQGLQDTLIPPAVGSDPNQAQTPLPDLSAGSQAEVVHNPADPMASSSSLPEAGETGKVAQTEFETSEGTIDLERPTTTHSTEAMPLKPEKKSKRKRPKDGSIIGSHVFTHDRVLLANSLESVLHFWMGVRQPEGVGIENVSRCGWCEFEEGCEWR